MGNTIRCSRTKTHADIHMQSDAKVGFKIIQRGRSKSKTRCGVGKRTVYMGRPKKFKSQHRRSLGHMKTDTTREDSDSDSYVSEPLSCFSDESDIHTTEQCTRSQIKPDAVPRLNFGFFDDSD